MLDINKIIINFSSKHIYQIVGSLFILIISLLIILIFKANNMANNDPSRMFATNEIIIEVTTAHLWFEEIMGGDANEDINEVLNHLYNAKLYIDNLKQENNKSITRAFVDSENLILIDQIDKLWKKFYKKMNQRYRHINISRMGSKFDQEFDDIFIEIVKKLEVLKKNIIEKSKNKKKDFSVMQYLAILFELLSFSLVSIAIYGFTKNKELLLKELKNLNINLEDTVKQRTKVLNDTLNDLKESQQKIIQNAKMASLGGLVAGVSHEINTPIGNSYTAISHLKCEIDKIIIAYKKNKMTEEDFELFLKELSESSSIIDISLKTASDLIRSFKSISVDQSYNKKRFFILKTYIEDVLLSLHNIIKQQKIILVINCDESLEINHYPSNFSQIITNLVQNSVIHGFRNIINPKITITVIINENDLNLVYKDNGVGIKKEDINKIFDPFFTTNRVNGGSGLGMHIIHNIITQNLKGDITCISDINQGVSFDIKIQKQEII